MSVLLRKVYIHLQKAEVTNLDFFGGDNRTRKEHKVRRNSGKPSSDLRAEFTQDGDRVSSDEVTGSAVRRAAPPH